MNPRIISFFGVALIVACAAAAHQTEPGDGAIRFRERSASFTLGAEPPRDDDKAIVLFDGAGWSDWITRDGKPSQWTLQDDGSIGVAPGAGDAMTRREFGDFQLHIEFLSPAMTNRIGQSRGNSGVYLHGRYEIQVLSNFGEPPANNGCGALYSIAAPAVNACAPAGQWQTYDIVFRAPRFDDAGNVTELPRVTVLHNGAAIHNNFEIPRVTGGAMSEDMPARGPILLQDHGDPVRYRNIWIRELN